MTENNDSIDNAVQTGLSSTSPGTWTATGTIGDNPNLTAANQNYDVDLAQFQMNGNATVTISLTASASGGANTLVQLFNGAGVVVASTSTSSDSNPLDRTITYTAPAGGTGDYYIGISGYANNTYDITDPYPDTGTDGKSLGTYCLERTARRGSGSPGNRVQQHGRHEYTAAAGLYAGCRRHGQ